MKVKETLSYTGLANKKPENIDIKDDEVIRIVSAGQPVRLLVNQDYLLYLRSVRASSMGGTDYHKYTIGELFEELDKILKIAEEDQ